MTPTGSKNGFQVMPWLLDASEARDPLALEGSPRDLGVRAFRVVMLRHVPAGSVVDVVVRLSLGVEVGGLDPSRNVVHAKGVAPRRLAVLGCIGVPDLDDGRAGDHDARVVGVVRAHHCPWASAYGVCAGRYACAGDHESRESCCDEVSSHHILLSDLVDQL